MPGFRLPVISYQNRFRAIWDIYVLTLTLLSAVLVPLQLAIHIPFRHSLLSYEILVSLSFGIDILFQLSTSYKEGNHEILDGRLIVKRYLRTWFVIDLFAAMPFFLLDDSLVSEAIPLIRTIRIVQIQRLFKLARLNTLLKEIYNIQSLSPGLLRLGYFVLLMTLAAHWLACGWILLGGIPGEENPVTLYIKAGYFTVTTLASVGYGDIVPVSNLQRIYAICVMMVGVGSYGFVIGNLASYLANRDVVRAKHDKKLEEVTAFLRYRAIPSNLRQQVMAYYAHLWDSRMGPEESAVLADLPDSLRVELALSMRRDLIAKVPFFGDADEDLIRDVVMALRPVVYVPGSLVIRQGDVGDCMFIVSSGTVEILATDNAKPILELQEGSFVGEMALVFQTNRNASVRAKGYCDLYILTKRTFDFILQKHPAFADHIREIANERRNESQSRQA
ncbi:MAG: cyclic nucleotide-binding domain-containing protein [Spirochaetia bacterium]|nr:cyclic nucleotide-binding domain-containing protein [Spirochaetia bacterium]